MSMRDRDYGDRSSRSEPFDRRGPREVGLLKVTGLSDGTNWQGLKEHFRGVGNVAYADVVDGVGTVEFKFKADIEKAMGELQGSTLDGSNITLEETRGPSKAPPKPFGGRGRGGFDGDRYGGGRSDRGYGDRERSDRRSNDRGGDRRGGYERSDRGSDRYGGSSRRYDD